MSYSDFDISNGFFSFLNQVNILSGSILDCPGEPERDLPTAAMEPERDIYHLFTPVRPEVGVGAGKRTPAIKAAAERGWGKNELGASHQPRQKTLEGNGPRTPR